MWFRGVLRPRSALAAVAGTTVGVLLGLGVYTFVYGQGYAYLSDDPEACANCHVMNEQLDAWQKSAHHTVATCNDCHTPSGLLGKYAVKAINGFNHSPAFTIGEFHEPIQVNDMNRKVAQAACEKCHEVLVDPLHWPGATRDEALPRCIRCHASVGHPR
jgi:cytochrome c nitrite reductase small subunit